ncbi:MAG TPA: oligopeptide/dipeptide ABC transporter ATP-binding protein [Planctomycetota bacterium]|nr:oligopeptide/dipeptide ABC transporter ATP-binding protein [Planctomycetota bacterium]
MHAIAMAFLEVRDLRKLFPIRRGVFGRTVGHVRAVDGVSLDLERGEALGLVGESGCGKTTAGRCLLRLIEPTGGSVRIDGRELTGIPRRALRPMRRDLQMIFQDPYGSLNPRLTVAAILIEPMLVHGIADRDGARARAADLLRRVGLKAEHLDHYPHQFSGGQRQRIGIARALALRPKLIVCDEPVSALDVSVQAQVLNLLKDVQEQDGIAYLFISHDLAVVAHLCQRVAVMYLGEIVEMGPAESILRAPLHPYTQALMSAVPTGTIGATRQRIVLAGDPPSPLEPSSAKRFTQRFPSHAAAFQPGEIRLQEAAPGHVVRCANLDVLRELAGRGAAAWV